MGNEIEHAEKTNSKNNSSNLQFALGRNSTPGYHNNQQNAIFDPEQTNELVNRQNEISEFATPTAKANGISVPQSFS